MAAYSGPAATREAPQSTDLAEWLRLRRPPPPGFVRTLDRLPPSLSLLVERALVERAHDQPIEGALLLPAEYYARPKSTWEFVPERGLVFLGDAVILACAKAADKPAEVTVLEAYELLYARSSLMLLYGLLEVEAVREVRGVQVRLEYNSVIWETFRASLARFVAAAYSPQSTAGDWPPGANAKVLQTLPYKFANGLQYNGLTPGERLEAAVFQPEIREGRWVFSRQRTPNTVFALTDQKLVIIEEALSLALHPQPKGEHGWVFTYIPRDRVADMVVEPGAPWAELKLRLAWGAAKDERSFVLDPSIALQWQRAWLDADSV